VGGAGFEPAYALRRGLQPRSFGRSDIPPGGSGGDSREGFLDHAARNRIAVLDLELGVLGAAKSQRCHSFDAVGRDEPTAAISNEHEEVIEPGGIQQLDQTIPALIPPARGDPDLPTTAPIGAGLPAHAALDRRVRPRDPNVSCCRTEARESRRVMPASTPLTAHRSPPVAAA
jgi:hypothetical protein